MADLSEEVPNVCTARDYWGSSSQLRGIVLLDPSKDVGRYEAPTEVELQCFTSSTIDALNGKYYESYVDTDRTAVYLQKFGFHLLRWKLRNGIVRLDGHDSAMKDLFHPL